MSSKMMDHKSVLALSLVLLIGCGEGTGQKPSVPKDANAPLVELRDLFVEAAGSPPLKSQSDLKQFENRYPAAVAGVGSGALTVVWGSGIKEGATAKSAIIGYETAADSQGGWVVREDASIEKMTADDFKKEAPKKVAPKK
jgi:hypothetical protein